MANEEEFDIVVIGGGPGGYATALYAAAAGLSVAIVERDKVGGTCLHRGCIPAKEFLETAAVRRTIEGSKEFGIDVSGVTLDFARSQERKQAVVDKLWKGLQGLLKGRKVTTLIGTGTLQEGRRVEVVDGPDAGRAITGRNVVLAAGSVPHGLPGFEVDGRWVMTSDEFLDLEKLPASVAVIGGGVVGCEFASLLADLGSKVTILEALDAILPGCDDDIVRLIVRSFKKRGIDIVTGVKVESHTPSADGTVTTVKAGEQSWDVEAVVVSVGRRPRTEGLVADGVGVQIDQRGFVVTDEYQRTGVDGVWAVGDIVAGTPQLAHVGFAEAIVVGEGHAGRAGGAGGQRQGAVGDLLPSRGRVLRHDRGPGQGRRDRRADEEGPLRRQQPGADHRRHRGTGEDRGREAAGRDGGEDPGRAHVRAVGHRAAERRVSRRQLGGVPRRGRPVHPAAPVALRDVRRDHVGPDRKGTAPWLTS